jgi:hypothetical protein
MKLIQLEGRDRELANRLERICRSRPLLPRRTNGDSCDLAAMRFATDITPSNFYLRLERTA